MKELLVFIGAIVISFALCLLMALPVMWLWNDLMPVVFGLKTINFLQALQLNVLCSILFQSSSSSSK